MKVNQIRKAMMEMYDNGGKLAGKVRSLYVQREIERFCTLIGCKRIYEYTTISKDVADILTYYGIGVKQQGIGFGISKEMITGGNIKMNKQKIKVTRQEVDIDIQNKFSELLGDYATELSNDVINYAIDDVLETSGISDEGYYNNSDVTLACQRALIHFVNKV